MAYGTPRNLDEVEPYYTDIRRGRKPSPEQLEELLERYRRVGGGTPLLEISQKQAAALGRALGDSYRVLLGMKHWHPYIREAVTEMKEAGIRRAVGVVLAPHYSRGSIGEYVERVESAKEALDYNLQIEVVPSWHLNSHYLSAIEAHIREALSAFRSTPEEARTGNQEPEARNQKPETSRPPYLIFTAHSLPQRVVTQGDPYQKQLLETCRAVAARLSLSTNRWTFSFQSAGRTPDPWLGPDLVETVERVAAEGLRDILVAPVGFISDHLEILYDIDVEARNAAAGHKARLERMRSLNDDPELIAALGEVATTSTSAGSVRPST